MRRKIIITLVLLISTMLPVKAITNYVDANVIIKINNEVQNFEVPPVIVDGRTLVPLRAIFEELGAKLNWEDSTQTITGTKGDTTVVLRVGQPNATVNGIKVELEVPPLIIQGRTMVPTRFIAESLGAEVLWLDSVRTIDITYENISNTLNTSSKIKQVDGVYLVSTDILGKPQLTDNQLLEMKGNPQLLQSNINTVNDLIRYLVIADFKVISGDTKIREGNYIWHHNRPGESTIRLNEGNCGATSSLVNYILKNTYDEVGFISYSESRGRGGHIFNYIYHNGEYYIIDFLQFAMNPNRGKFLWNVDSFEQFGDFYKNRYTSGIKLFVKYTSDDVLPIAQNETTEQGMMYYEKGSNVTAFYETVKEDFVLKFIDPPKTYPSWN